ncbi:MAG TPA: hypothetical protein VEJ89_09110 [Myxococcaceae bacterium]|jgi:uncharacterized membrane protein|nr:hypothetical protein [Myxococcaceae bacterium]
MKKTLKGAVVASAVASLFAAGAFAQADKPAPAADKGIKCSGVNSCKGTGSCAGAGHGCAGKNSCKGTGWSYTKTEKDCTDKGGKVVTASKK